jgi:hypothetical protein
MSFLPNVHATEEEANGGEKSEDGEEFEKGEFPVECLNHF